LTGVERLGIPNWMATDGPNGARGSSLLGSGEARATCIPCGSALGATWDPELVEELGVMLGRETRTKAARVLLAPTLNLHRSPRAGRNFECYSEDPLLAGVLAAAYCRGVQSQGVIATAKHFVGNEAETDRWTSNSIIDDRALREIYLLPFEYAVTDGGALGVMTSYNRLNGVYCTEQRWLLTDLLRDEWGFEGFVTTDWFAAGETVKAAEAGLDIEMPAGDRMYGSVLATAVRDGQVPESTLDLLAGRMLSTFERIGAFDDEPAVEHSFDVPEHRALARRAAAASMVLLRNEPVTEAPGGENQDGEDQDGEDQGGENQDGEDQGGGDQGGGDPGGGAPAVRPVLPLDPARLSSIAVIGPNAGRAQIMGGGSAGLRPFHRTSPLAAFRTHLGPDLTITHSEGANIDKQAPLLTGEAIQQPGGGQGFRIEVFHNLDWSGQPAGVASRDTSRILVGDEPYVGGRPGGYSVRARTHFTPPTSGDHTFEIVQITPSRLFLDGELVIDGITERPPVSAAFFGFGSIPITHTARLEAGTGYELLLETSTENGAVFTGLDLRVSAPQAADPRADAVAAARAADVAVVVVGTNDDWETEGEDRTSLSLPGHQDALIKAVVEANPRTVVVVNTGSPVLMPWAHSVPAVIQSWLGGQEMADALVDVLTGETDPGGRLPTSFPLCEEHNPAFATFPGDNGRVPYAESIFVGYRWYDSRRLPVQFPFGHGLSYTRFEIGEPSVRLDAGAEGAESTAVNGAGSLPVDHLTGGGLVMVSVPVTNVGDRAGSHVVQCYVRPHRSRIVRPDKELKAFEKVGLEPGQSRTISLTLNHRSFAYWDPAQPDWTELRARTAATLPQLQHQDRRTEPGWTIEPGPYDILIANSATDVVTSTTVELV
ncbi:MAG: glycoside hydrolase family 3 C-terminal domain-containing protein, partial [Acidimicrobiia bacterium]|nr:glycoside hydrolase family 3 C-terminal domain-containing protein [Acidimicrobiia bacterium]